MSLINSNGSAAGQGGPFASRARQVFDRGYNPVLLAERDKKPFLPAWNTYTRNIGKGDIHLPESVRGLYFSESVVSNWASTYPNANLGVATGSARGDLMAFDIDTDVSAIVDIIMSVLPSSPVMKFGKKGFTPFFRNDGTVRSRALIGKGGERIADVLAGGKQTVLPPSIHPDTGKAYEWTPGFAALWDVPIADLPWLSQAHVDEIVRRLIAAGLMELPKAPMVLVPADIQHVKENLKRYVANARKKLQEKAADLSKAPVHTRREAVNGLGYALGPHVLHGLIEEETVRRAVLDACEKNGKLAEFGGYHEVSKELAKAMAAGAAKLQLPMLRDNNAPAALAGWEAELLAAGVAPFTAEQMAQMRTQSNVVSIHGMPMPPPPAGYVPTPYVHADGTVGTHWSPASGSGGATALATWSQPQTVAVPPTPLLDPWLDAFSMDVTPNVLRAGRDMPRRPFLYGQDYIRRETSALYAPGGGGKTALAAVELLSIVTGRPLLGVAPKRPLRVIFLGEDGIEEIERRLIAACELYGIDWARDVAGRCIFRSLRNYPLLFAVEGERGGFKVNTPHIEATKRLIRNHGADVVYFDTMKKIHGVSENDNGAMDALIGQLNMMAEECNCANMVLAHTRKPSGYGERSIDDARGGRAQLDALRSARILVRMTKEEAEKLEIDPGKAWRYIRIGDSKENMAPPADRARWYQLTSRTLENGDPLAVDDFGTPDNVQVVMLYMPQKDSAEISEGQLNEIKEAMVVDQWRMSDQTEYWAGYPIGRAMGIEIGCKADTKQKTAERSKARKILNQLLDAGVLEIYDRLNEDRKMKPFVRVKRQLGPDGCTLLEF